MQENMVWIDDATQKIREKMAWVSDKNKNKVPYTTTADGSYDDRSHNWLNWWTNGFWGGIMWLLYQDTNEQKYADYAQILEDKLEKIVLDFYEVDHDSGFMFHLTAGANYRLTGNKKSRRTNLHAANLLAGRYNPSGAFIRAWNGPSDYEYQPEGMPLERDVRGWAIIDCLMNLAQLYWASMETRDPRFYNIAVNHADMALAHFFHPNGSVKHIVEFDPQTGEMIKNYGGQGYDQGSAWSRGQAWAVYGFTISYIHTNDHKYLDAAKKVANFCISNLRADGLVPLDFKQPAEPAWEDSCGACIMASGLLEIARQVSGDEKEIYENAAVKILKAIYDLRTDFSQECDAIVQNCSAAYHDETGRHITMTYADYFFIEAIQKLKGIGISLW